MIRLNKLLVQKGLCSRREADRYIRDGLVTVNGMVQTQLGVKVPMDEENVVVELLPAAQRMQNQQATILFHKPLGIVSCQPKLESSPSMRAIMKDSPQQLCYTPAIQCCTAEQEYDPMNQKKKNFSNNQNTLQERQRPKRGRSSSTSPLPEPRQQTGWAVAGRLDINSTGLLVLTQSGRLASQIIRPDSNIEKEYLVRLSTTPFTKERSAGSGSSTAVIRPRLDGDFPETLTILQRFLEGILDQGQLLQAERVDIINNDQVRFVLRQGKHHQIRRMCAAVGWSVQALKRVRIGKVVLGDLPLGQWRYLGKHESFQ